MTRRRRAPSAPAERLLFRTGPGAYATDDGRFALARHMRPAQRGGGDPVQDGWTLTDTLTGASVHVEDVNSDATRRVGNVLREEAVIREHLDRVAGWRAPGRHSPRNPLAELRFVDATGDPCPSVSVLMATARFDAALPAVLAHFGLPSDLPETGL